MKKVVLYMMLLATVGALKPAMAANIIRTVSVSVNTGNECVVEVQIDNAEAFVAFQADIPIPAGLSYVEGSAQLNPLRSSRHSLSASIRENSLRLVTYSSDNTPFFGSEGTLISFTLKAGTVPGTYPMELTNTLLGNTLSQPLAHSIENGTVTVLGPNFQVSATNIDFGRVALTTAGNQYLNIQNIGNQDLVISSIHFTDAQFSSPEAAGFVLTAGQSRQISVSFAPTVKGTYSEEMKITSNDPDTPEVVISLKSVGFAVNEIHLGTATGRSGYTVTLPVYINNMEPFTGFQAEIFLPEQVKYIPGSARLSSRAGDHQIAADTTKNKLTITAYSASNADFSGSEGEIGTLDFFLEGNGGNYYLNFSEAIIADRSAINIISASYNNYIRIKSPYISLSATNHNFGSISVLDSSAYTLEIRNYGDDTLKINSIVTNAPEFTVSKETYLVKVVPYQTKNISVKFKSTVKGVFSGRLMIRNNDANQDPIYCYVQGVTFEPNELHVMDGSGKAGELTYLLINLENYTAISAFQFDLLLPDGFSVVADSCSLTERRNDHSLAINEVSANTFRFVSYSGSLKTYFGNSGPVLNVALAADQSVQPGNYNISMQNVILSDEGSVNMVSNYRNGQFTVLPESICQNLQFQQGWNIFSSPGAPNPADMKTIFQPLIDNASLVKIQDELGNSLENYGMFGGWQNNIGDMSQTEGYKIKVNTTNSLEVCGTPVNYPFAVPLKNGWNIIGYPQTAPFDAMEIVQQLIDRRSLLKVQDESGNAIEDHGMFGGWQNNIGNLTPGKGYKIKVSSNDTLWINEVYTKSLVAIPELIPTTHFKPIFEGNGVDHMNINIVHLPSDRLHPGDELAVFDEEICVGAVTLMPHHFECQNVSIPVSSKDELGMPGFTEGNPVIIKLWSSKNNQEYELLPEILKGTSTFIKHESTLVSLENFTAIQLHSVSGEESIEIKYAPNPFKNRISIRIYSSEPQNVSIEIRDVSGRLVRQLFNGTINGFSEIEWDGKNSNGTNILPGLYVCVINQEKIKIIKH